MVGMEVPVPQSRLEVLVSRELLHDFQLRPRLDESADERMPEIVPAKVEKLSVGPYVGPLLKEIVLAPPVSTGHVREDPDLASVGRLALLLENSR